VSKRRPLRAVVAAVIGAVGLVACGGHDPGAAGPSAHPTATATPPLKVVSVKPRKLKPTGPITVSFASPLTPQSPLPTLKPAVPGAWTRTGTSAVFTPSQAYPPDTAITVKVAKRVSAPLKKVATRKTPSGSLLRAEQILARLHYLPLKSSAPALTTATEEANAVYQPPPGKFTWRYPDTPTVLKQDWSPGQSGQVLRGAIIAFQHQANLPMDALIGEHTWQALTAADLAHKVNSDHYSFVSANLYLPQRLSVWVDGHTVLTSPVNGGVPGAPTPLGTYPVYDRYTSTTMSGTNPSGSTYSDPGVPWVSYFSGGSAVHGFPRASYGSPQSVGCLELPIPTAKQVYGLIDYGTLVNVIGPHVSSTTSAHPAPPAGASAPSAKPHHH
jgi:peptidoglycan hydrolase-like protein with peptidoglycan-binding domain